MPPLLELDGSGLFCPAGKFHIDPWGPVDRAVLTHAHCDHARPGSRAYLAARPGETLLRARLGPDAPLQSLDYGEPLVFDGVRVSLHPAGHLPGSAQVRVEHEGQVWVVSGDYQLDPDPTCTPFEPLRCHAFVTEAAFALPIYRWPPRAQLLAEIQDWWRENQQARRGSVLFAYALGKAQRLLAALEPIGPIYTSAAVERFAALYRASGIALPETVPLTSSRPAPLEGALILASPMAHATPWLRQFGEVSTALASGWMRIRGTRRRRSLDRGFVFADHPDWPGLLATIDATRCERVWITHGYRGPLLRWLEEKGLEALAVETRFASEQDELGTEPEP